ncbi:MAG: tRNA-guanine transglycosylase, partial [Candidatus Nitrosocaldaceae archaeon]
MKDILEVSNTDLDARIGILHTKHGKIEVPTFVPVVHPIKQEISIDVIKRLGFDLVITNAYITMKYYGKEINESIHNIINFDKSIMTDSGGYQVLEYGDLDVDYDEVARFESRIKSDIAVPLDKPTG